MTTIVLECRCGHSGGVDLREAGRHVAAHCRACSSYIKFVSRAELGLAPRSLRTRENVSVHTRARILARDNFMCLCGHHDITSGTLDVDHLIPVELAKRVDLADDFIESDDNLTTLCEACNSGKAINLPTARLIARIQLIRARQAEAMAARGLDQPTNT